MQAVAEFRGPEAGALEAGQPLIDGEVHQQDHGYGKGAGSTDHRGIAKAGTGFKAIHDALGAEPGIKFRSGPFIEQATH